MSRTFAGVDIGGTNVKLAIVSARGKMLARGVIPTRASEGPDALLERVAGRLQRLAGRRTITAAGIGCAGLVDRASGRLQVSPNLPGWQNTDLAGIARRWLGVYTIIDNDANAAAWGEYVMGSGRGCRLLILITLGTGVGGSIVADGRMIRGAGNYAGEIGHMTIDPKGPRCRCGQRGCLEAYLGSYALVRRARALARKRGGRLLGPLVRQGVELTPKIIFDAARAGDRTAVVVVDEAARYLGIALASLVNVLNPDRIALGGGVAGAFALMRPLVTQTVAEQAFAPSARQAKIARARLGNTAASIGAALMARDEVS